MDIAREGKIEGNRFPTLKNVHEFFKSYLVEQLMHRELTDQNIHFSEDHRKLCYKIRKNKLIT